MSANLNIIAPWYEYQKQLKALFEHDPAIIVSEVYEPEGQEVNYAIDIDVRDHQKFIALENLLPATIEFGNVTLGIVLFDEENANAEDAPVTAFKSLFQDNPIVQDIRVVTDQFGTPHCYILFRPEVIQYYRDDMTDYNGLCSCLAQDIARVVFNDNSGAIHFCTAPVEGNGAANQ